MTIEERCVFLENGLVGDNEWVLVDIKESPKLTAINWLKTHPEFYSYDLYCNDFSEIVVVVRKPNDKEFKYNIEITPQYKAMEIK